jgi:hypothetical protein
MQSTAVARTIDRTRIARSGIAIVVTAAGMATTWPAVASDPSATPSGSASPASAYASPSAAAEVSAVGTVRITNRVLGGGTYPAYSLQIPEGWEASGPFTIKSSGGPQVMGVGVWDVGAVPGDPCHWGSTTWTPGPSVDELVAALQAQVTRNASATVEVTLAGHPGRYLEWSVPADAVVTGDSDFQGCDLEPSDGHRNFVSWFGAGQGTRYQQVAGQVDRLWILDVDGQRLVVDATYSPDATPADLEELDRVVRSLEFGP